MDKFFFGKYFYLCPSYFRFFIGYKVHGSRYTLPRTPFKPSGIPDGSKPSAFKPSGIPDRAKRSEFKPSEIADQSGYQSIHSGLTELYAAIYSGWLPGSGYGLRNSCSFEKYLNHPQQTKEEDLFTEIYIPVESLN